MYHDYSHISTLNDTALFSLYEAVRHNEPDRLGSLLKANKLHNDQEHMSMALHMAAQRGHVECGTTLLEAGVSPDAHNAGGYTALILAARHGHSDFIKMLISENCNLQKTVYQTGASALHWAASSGVMGSARALVEAGCNVDAKSHHGWTPLMVAASIDDIHFVNLFLENGADPLIRDNNRGTALHIAASEGAVTCVGELLSAGVDINIRDKFGKTPLHNAAYRSEDQVISCLVNEKCDVNVRDNNGLTPLHYTALYDTPTSARRLLDSGADPTIVVRKSCKAGEDEHVKKNSTPLMMACKRNCSAVVKMLLEYPETLQVVQATDADGLTALQHACSSGSSECILPLLEAGVDPDGFDSKGFNLDTSPLNLAIASKCYEAVKALVLGNCSINESNIMNAICAEHLQIAKLLVAAYHRPLSPDFLAGIFNDPSCIYQDNIEGFLQWCDSFIHPRTLLHTCRCIVRNALGLNIFEMVTLPLPTKIIQFVAFNDLNHLC